MPNNRGDGHNYVEVAIYKLMTTESKYKVKELQPSYLNGLENRFSNISKSRHV